MPAGHKLVLNVNGGCSLLNTDCESLDQEASGAVSSL